MTDITDRGGLFATDDADAPLAARIRPSSFEDMVGQEHLIAPDSMLRRAVEQDRLPSLLLVGPAGSGKSTLALIIAEYTNKRFERMSAVSSGVADIRQAAKDAEDARDLHDTGTIVFLDEIHRLAKNQQDALLPYVEEGTFTLIGATTENPFYTITSPLRSRCQIYRLEKLDEQDLNVLIDRALGDSERGLGNLGLQIHPEAREHLIINGARGDARKLLSTLELAARTAVDEDAQEIRIGHIEEALQQPVLKYDRAGDEHYDTISAFIKSMRGSDPDAAIYWLAKMLQAGEDPEFIARRIIIQAAEDVGLADPTALRVATAAADAVKYVGMPEARIPLAMATLHLALAPKSNSAYLAISQATDDVAEEGAARVPSHLAGGERVGEKDEYQYPHDHPGARVEQDYLPPGLQRRQYYTPGDNPREQRIAEWLETIRGNQSNADEDSQTGQEDRANGN